MTATPRPPHRRILAGAAVAAFLGSACTSTDPTFLDVTALEEDIRVTLSPAYEAEGMTFFGVTCADRDWEGGDVLACVADVERQFVRVRVEVGGAPGTWDWTTLDIVHRLDATEDLVGQQMSDSLGDRVRLDCGSPRLRVLPIGASFRCDAIDSAGNIAPALLTVNGSGQTGWEVLG